MRPGGIARKAAHHAVRHDAQFATRRCGGFANRNEYADKFGLVFIHMIFSDGARVPNGVFFHSEYLVNSPDLLLRFPGRSVHVFSPDLRLTLSSYSSTLAEVSPVKFLLCNFPIKSVPLNRDRFKWNAVPSEKYDRMAEFLLSGTRGTYMYSECADVSSPESFHKNIVDLPSILNLLWEKSANGKARGSE